METAFCFIDFRFIAKSVRDKLDLKIAIHSLSEEHLTK